MTVNDPQLAAMPAARLAPAAEALAVVLPSSHIGSAGFATHAPHRRPGRRASADPGPSLGSGSSPGSGARVTKRGAGYDGSEDEFHHGGEVWKGSIAAPGFRTWRKRQRRREAHEKQEAAARLHDTS